MEEFLNKEGVVQTVQAIKDYVDQQDSAIQQNIEQNITGRIATLENQISNKVDKTQIATKQQPGLSRTWEENEIFHIWTMDPEQLNYTTEENEAGGETYDIRTLNYSIVPNEFGGETYYFGESAPQPPVQIISLRLLDGNGAEVAYFGYEGVDHFSTITTLYAGINYHISLNTSIGEFNGMSSYVTASGGDPNYNVWDYVYNTSSELCCTSDVELEYHLYLNTNLLSERGIEGATTSAIGVNSVPGPQPGDLHITRVYIGSAGSDDTLSVIGGTEENPIYGTTSPIHFERNENYTFIVEATDGESDYEFSGFCIADFIASDFPSSKSNYFTINILSGTAYLSIVSDFYGNVTIALPPVQYLLEHGNLDECPATLTYQDQQN